jgi:hypothetical protein
MRFLHVLLINKMTGIQRSHLGQITFFIFKNMETEFIVPVARGDESAQGLDVVLDGNLGSPADVGSPD